MRRPAPSHGCCISARARCSDLQFARGRHPAHHRHVRRWPLRCGGCARRPRLVCHRQPADRAGRHHRRTRRTSGERHRTSCARGWSAARRAAAQGGHAAVRGPHRADAVPRRLRLGLGEALRRHPPQASARRAGVGPRRGDRARTHAARTGEGCGRPGDRHERSERAPVEGEIARRVRRRGRVESPADRRRELRVQARRAGRARARTHVQAPQQPRGIRQADLVTRRMA